MKFVFLMELVRFFLRRRMPRKKEKLQSIKDTYNLIEIISIYLIILKKYVQC